MRVLRFIVADLKAQLDQSQNKSEFFLSKSESHHLENVLRAFVGQKIEVSDGAGTRCVCAIGEFTANGARCVVEERLNADASSSAILLIAAVAPAKCDLIVEKAVELGAAQIHFFRAARTQEQLKAEQIAKRLTRFERIAQSALKQSGALALPQIGYTESLDALLSKLHGPDNPYPRPGRVIFLPPKSGDKNGRSEDARSEAQAPVITNLFSALGYTPPSVENHHVSTLEVLEESVDSYALVGPEGGFSEGEISLASRWNYQPAFLGPNVLRTETAAILALGCIGLIRFSMTEGKKR